MDKRDVFSRKAELWWDLDGPFKMLHRMNACRMQEIERKLGKLNAKRILDYGCGGGILSESLARSGASVTGIDMSDESIEIAKIHAKKENLSINYLTGTVDDIPDGYFAEDQFDVICLLECLEHVVNPEKLLMCLSGCLKDDGHMVISTINRSLYTYLMAIIAAEYLLGWVEPGTHEHEKFIKPSELVRMSEMSNLQAVALSGMSFSMKDQDFYLSTDVSLNYIAIFKKQRI